MSAEVENAGTVVLLEATAEARTLIEDLTRLAEELKVRQERLGELLAPSEAALRARTEYLDKVIREELSRAEERILRLSEDVERIARSLSDHMVQMPRRLTEADARRWDKREKSERWRTVVSLLAMLLGGFLAGQVASYRSGATANAKPVAVEETSPTRKKSAPSAPRRPAGEREAERRPGRALSREEIAKSADLQRRYAREYASMLRVVSDREVAKEVARVNVSALVAGQPRIVPFEGRLSIEKLRSALTRGGEDLSVIRRAVSRLVEQAPEISRLRIPPGRDFGPER